MADGSSNSIVNLGDISKPADTLIRKISKAFGTVFEPYQLTRMAKAEVAADMIRAEGEIAVTDLQRRAMRRFVNEEAIRQENIETIAGKAIPLLSDQAGPDAVEDDWITNFLEKCRIVSDDEMQDLWSRILAGEANFPGSFSRRTVNFLADLDKRDVEMFTLLCRFGCLIGGADGQLSGPFPLVFNASQNDIYETNGLSFGAISHLESIGLIKVDSLRGFKIKRRPQLCEVAYFGELLQLKMPEASETNELPVGDVLLTNTGNELSQMCDVVPIDGFTDLLREKWLAYFPDLSAKPTDEIE